MGIRGGVANDSVGTVPNSGARRLISGDQNPDRMWFHEQAFNAARVHKGLPVEFAYRDLLKEFVAKHNREPDPDQARAGVISGLKADMERREREGSP